MHRLIFFLRFFGWFNLRHLLKHPGRAMTVLLGIALGAAVFTSVRLSIHASLESFTRSMEMIAGRSERVLIRPGGRVPEDLTARLLIHPLVESASPLLTTYVKPKGETAEPFLLIGFDPILDRAFRDWQVQGPGAGEATPWIGLLKDPYTLLMGSSLAMHSGCAPGDIIALEHSRHTAEFQVAGTLDSRGLALVEGGRVALTDIATFQEFTGIYGFVDRIDLIFKKTPTPDESKSFESQLPRGVVSGSPVARKESGRGLIRAYQLNLSILSFASLFVGMFLVYSLVALNAAARRTEVAVMLSLGASSKLVFVLFLAEGALLGAAGWFAAIPMSSFLVKYLLHGVTQTISTLFIRVRVETLSLGFWEIGWSFAVTVVISVLAALQPAREAMRVRPKEALETPGHGVGRKKSPAKSALAGLLCLLAVLPLSRFPGGFGIPLPGYLAILSLFVGFSLMAPWFLSNLGDALSPLLHRVAGLPAYLAARYIRDSGTRTAVSVGALITAVALFASLVIMIFSFRQTVALWTRQTISGDLFLTPRLNEINEFRDRIPTDAADWFKSEARGIDAAPSCRYFLTYTDFGYEFEVLDLNTFLKYADFFWMKGNPETTREQLLQGKGVVVSEVFSNRTGLSIGDHFRAGIESSVVDLPILAVVRDYRTRGGVVFYSLDHFIARYHDPGWSGIRFFFQDRDQDLNLAVAAFKIEIVQRWGDAFDMISGTELRDEILRVFDETFAVTSVLLLIALVVAALGVATTLAVRVMERSWQLNTLVAVGAGLNQIRSMIFWEAALMVLAGELAGVLCGFLLSYLLIYVINLESFGWTFLYRVDWGALALSLPLIVLAAMTAALPAVRLVFRAPPAAVLREGTG